MATDCISGPRVTYSREIGKKTYSMVTVSINLPTDLSTKESSSMANSKGRDTYNTQAKTKTILKHMKAVGKKLCPMAEEKPSTKTETPTKETSSTVSVQVLAFTSSIVVSGTRESGKIIIFMEMVSYLGMGNSFFRANFKMV